MKNYTVVIYYDNDGTVCQYFYHTDANNMEKALNGAMEEFRNFMRLNNKIVEVLEINAWISSDPVEDCLKELNDDDYYEVKKHMSSLYGSGVYKAMDDALGD